MVDLSCGGYGVVVVVTAWWLRRGCGGYGVVVDLSCGGYSVVVVVTAWWLIGLGGYGVVVDLSSHRLKPPATTRRDPRLQIFFFSFLSSHRLKPLATTRRDPQISSQIWTHRGQPPPRRDPRRGSLLRSVTTEATP